MYGGRGTITNQGLEEPISLPVPVLAVLHRLLCNDNIAVATLAAELLVPNPGLEAEASKGISLRRKMAKIDERIHRSVALGPSGQVVPLPGSIPRTRRTSFHLSLLPAALAAIRGSKGGCTGLDSDSDEGASLALVLYDKVALEASFAAVQLSFDEVASASINAHVNGTNESNLFPVRITHCLAIKSAPLSHVMHLAVLSGLGLEAASWAECLHALRLGCAPENVVFDSPCKTDAELRAAFRARVVVNANSLGELKRISAIILEEDEFKAMFTACNNVGVDVDVAVSVSGSNGELSSGYVPRRPTIGLRINPLVGSGSIPQLATATVGSKFGVPFICSDDEPNARVAAASANANSATVPPPSCHFSTPLTPSQLLAVFRANPFLSALHVHSGSQGMSSAALVQGARVAAWAADFLEASGVPIDCVDIGGGLSVDYFPQYRGWGAGVKPYQAVVVEDPKFSGTTAAAAAAAAAAPTAAAGPDSGPLHLPSLGTTPTPAFYAYARELRTAAPSLFVSRNPRRRLLTEFGKALVAGAGVAVLRVEDVIWSQETEADDGLGCTCIVHAGADLLLRESYDQAHFAHRMGLFRDGHPLSTIPSGPQARIASESQHNNNNNNENELRCALAGPLCFSGDSLGSVRVPQSVKPERGDDAVVLDCGANTISLYSRHCSRSAPGVWLVWEEEEEEENTKRVRVECIKSPECLDNVLSFWS